MNSAANEQLPLKSLTRHINMIRNYLKESFFFGLKGF